MKKINYIACTLLLAASGSQAVVAQETVEHTGLTYSVKSTEITSTATSERAEDSNWSIVAGNYYNLILEDGKVAEKEVKQTISLELLSIGDQTMPNLTSWEREQSVTGSPRTTVHEYSIDSPQFAELGQQAAAAIDDIYTWEEVKERQASGTAWNVYEQGDATGYAWDEWNDPDYEEDNAAYVYRYVEVKTRKGVTGYYYVINTITETSSVVTTTYTVNTYQPTTIAAGCDFSNAISITLGNKAEISTEVNPFAGAPELISYESQSVNYKVDPTTGFLYTADRKTLITVPANAEGSYDLPATVEAIATNACANCTGVTLVAAQNITATLGGEDNVLKVPGISEVIFEARGVKVLGTIDQATIDQVIATLKADTEHKKCYVDFTEATISGTIAIAECEDNQLWYFPEGARVEGQNIVIGNHCTELTLNGESSVEFCNVRKFSADNVTVVRNLKADRWSTIMLPFSTTSANCEYSVSDCRSAMLTKYTPEDKKVYFTYCSDFGAFSANTPYVLRMFEDFTSLAFSDVTINVTEGAKCSYMANVGGANMIGSYSSLVINEATQYYISASSGNILQANKTNIKPFRCYIELPEAVASTQLQTIYLDEEDQTFGFEEGVDGIHSTQSADSAEAGVKVVDLTGKTIKTAPTRSEAISGLQAGIYVINGQKVTIK